MADLDAVVADFLKSLERFSAEERTQVAHALEIAIEAHKFQKREDGSPYTVHVIAVAALLHDWGGDSETLIAGLLHDAIEDSGTTYHAIRQAFGRRVAALVEGVTKFSQADFDNEQLDRKVETLRKLLEVMRSDIRVVLIKLADRLHNIRTINTLPSDRKMRFARETMDVYYKLAYHLGLNDIRREFSDVCMPILHPEEVGKLEHQRESSKPKWEKLREQSEREIREVDTEHVLQALLYRPRSYYSLYTHQAQNIEKNPFYLIAIVPDPESCYRFLQLLHTLYRPIGGAFRDLIAAPTESGYHSLHTVVIGPGGNRVQFRIRTPTMEALEAKGVLLKRFGFEHGSMPGFSWLERSETLDLSTRESSAAFWEALQTDILQETFAVTVDEQSIRLPRGSTVLDAVYARYGREGNRLRHGLVNGTLTSSSTVLAEDDVVQVQLDGHEQVSFSWLSSVATQYARSMITDALKQRDQSEKVGLGQRLLQQEFDRFQRGLIGELTRTQKQQVAQEFRRKDFDEVISMIGEGVLRPTDVLFALFPEHRRYMLWRKKAPSQFHFRLRVGGTYDRSRDPYATVSAVAGMHSTRIKNADLRADEDSDTFELTLRGESETRLDFADFLVELEKIENISHTQTLLSNKERLGVLSLITLAFGAIFLDVLFLPQYSQATQNFPLLLAIVVQALPLFPVLAINYYLLRLLQHYFVALRQDRWFIGIGFLINILGVIIILLRTNVPQHLVGGLLPFVAVFVFSMLWLGYRYFQTEHLVEPSQIKRSLSAVEWKALRRRKIMGYGFRLCAVIVWGIQPLYHRYTPVRGLHPFMSLFLMSVGIVGTALCIFLVTSAWRQIRGKSLPSIRLPHNKEFLMILIGGAFFTYFLNASLRLTTSTNYILFLNFAPVLALLIGTLFWRKTIPYLQHPHTILWIFVTFLLESTGSSLIIYSTLQHTNAGTLTGDLFGIMAMIADTLFIIGQIRFMKLVQHASSAAINIHIFSLVAVIALPIILYLGITHSPILAAVTQEQIWYALGAGALSAVGQTLNYETFRRIDGFIAVLMFNVSVFITFSTEVFFLESFTPSIILLIGGCIVIGSTIIAEYINTLCEKKGL